MSNLKDSGIEIVEIAAKAALCMLIPQSPRKFMFCVSPKNCMKELMKTCPLALYNTGQFSGLFSESESDSESACTLSLPLETMEKLSLIHI